VFLLTFFIISFKCKFCYKLPWDTVDEHRIELPLMETEKWLTQPATIGAENSPSCSVA